MNTRKDSGSSRANKGVAASQIPSASEPETVSATSSQPASLPRNSQDSEVSHTMSRMNTSGQKKRGAKHTTSQSARSVARSLGLK